MKLQLAQEFLFINLPSSDSFEHIDAQMAGNIARAYIKGNNNHIAVISLNVEKQEWEYKIRNMTKVGEHIEAEIKQLTKYLNACQDT